MAAAPVGAGAGSGFIDGGANEPDRDDYRVLVSTWKSSRDELTPRESSRPDEIPALTISCSASSRVSDMAVRGIDAVLYSMLTTVHCPLPVIISQYQSRAYLCPQYDITTRRPISLA